MRTRNSEFGGTHTGFTNTDIIGNYDLHPNEGYEFKNHGDAPRQTLNTKSSKMFPLNKKINDQVPKKQRPAEPEGVIEKPMPQVRSHRSRLIYETMVNTRKQQVDYLNQKKDYEAEQKTIEQEEENAQIELAKQKQARELAKRKQKMKELNKVYEEQLQDVEKRKQKEREEELQYERILKQQDIEQAKDERKRQERLRKIAEERKTEFQKRNDELLMRRAARQEQEIEEEKRIQREASEVQARQEERQREDERRRMEKTEMRSRLVEQQLKELKNKSQKNDDIQEAAESAAARSKAKEILALKTKQEGMIHDRHSEWIKLQKERTVKSHQYTKRPFPSKKKEQDALEFEMTQRKREEERLKRIQYAQIQERKRQEQKEIDDDLALDQSMLATSKAQFEKSLQQLKTLIPEELGISVPLGVF